MFILSSANLGFFPVGSSIYRTRFNYSGVSGVEGFNAPFSSLVDVWVRVAQSLLHLLYQRLRGKLWGSTLCLWLFSVPLLVIIGSHWYHLLDWRKLMATPGVADLVVQLEDSLDLAALDHGVKLVGKVPWAVMKKNFSVKKWFPNLAVEEVQLELVPFWVQIRGVPLGLSSLANVKRLTQTAGQVLELEDPAKARGFLRVKVLVNTAAPLINGCWLRRESKRETWVEFRYERLQDFCYKCGRVDHLNTECPFAINPGGEAGYGEWLKAPPIRDEVFISRPSVSGVGARRIAGAVRGAAIGIDQSRGNDSRQHQRREVLPMMVGSGETPQSQCSATRKWRRKSKTQDVSSMAFLNETDDRSSTRWNTLGRNISPQAVHDLSPHGERESVVINAGTHQHSVSSPRSSGLLSTIAGEVQGTWLNPRSVLAEASGMKMGGGCQSWDLVQHPFKKVRGIRDPGGSSGLLGGNWQGLNVQERCLMIQRAVYTEVEPSEGSSMSTRVLAHVEAELVDEQHPSVTQEAGNVARGGDGWPSTSARLP
ncbi:hypothetical protein ACFX15_045569 [Malus domestica]